MGCRRERWRYHSQDESLLNPHEAALQASVQTSTFPEITRQLAGEKADWEEVDSGPWRREEDVFLLEAHAAVRAVRAVASDAAMHHARCVLDRQYGSGPLA